MSNLRRYGSNDPFEDLFRGFFVRPVGVGQNQETPEVRGTNGLSGYSLKDHLMNVKALKTMLSSKLSLMTI